MSIKIETKTKEIHYVDSFKLYLKLSENGKNIGLLMESKSQNKQYEKVNYVIPNLAIKIIGKNEDFRIEALTKAGEEILSKFTKKDFSYAEEYTQDKKSIYGKVRRKNDPNASEEEAFKQTNPSFVLKTILKKFKSASSYPGLYGAFAYDFARNYYPVKKKLKDEGCADFELFIPTKIIVINDTERRAMEVNFIFNGKSYPNEKPTKGFEYKKQKKEIKHDLTDEEYKKSLGNIIKDIKNGRAMQCVLSRRTTMTLQRHPINAYAELRETSPSPYSFYYNLGNNEVLYGASPEMHIKITGEKHNQIEIRPIAGTINRSPNPLEDAEARRNILTDEKELREHTMLVDLARHELYKLSNPRSVIVTDLFTLEEYPNLYHLVSGVRGEMQINKDSIDALLVTMPAGTLSGAPKLEAMKMIEEYEGSKRGYYGGTIGVLSFNGDCNTGITIRSVHVKNNKSEVRGGGGITALSTTEGEFEERKLKLEKSLQGLEEKGEKK